MRAGTPNSGKRGPETTFECSFLKFLLINLKNCKIVQKQGRGGGGVALLSPPLNLYMNYKPTIVEAQFHPKVQSDLSY